MEEKYDVMDLKENQGERSHRQIMQAMISTSFSVKGVEIWTYRWQGQQSQEDCFLGILRGTIQQKIKLLQHRRETRKSSGEMKGLTLDSCINHSLMVTEKGYVSARVSRWWSLWIFSSEGSHFLSEEESMVTSFLLGVRMQQKVFEIREGVWIIIQWSGKVNGLGRLSRILDNIKGSS